MWPLIGLSLLIGSAYLCYRWGWTALGGLIAATGAMALAAGGLVNAPVIIGPVFMGGIGGIVFRRGWSFQFFMLVTSLVVTALFVSAFYYVILVAKVDVIAFMREWLTQYLTNTGTTEAARKELLELMVPTREELLQKIPYGTFYYVLLMAGVGFMVLRMYFRRMVGGLTSVKGLEQFVLDDHVIFVLIGAWAGYLLVDKDAFTTVSTVCYNVGMITVGFYFVQALGIIKFAALGRGMPPYIIPVLVLMIVMTGLDVGQYVILFLAGFGALDIWTDFRKFRKDPNEENGL